MSAWVPGKEHIDAMIEVGLTGTADAPMPVPIRGHFSWYCPGIPIRSYSSWYCSGSGGIHTLDYGLTGTADATTVDKVGQMLTDEVVASVRHRYPNDGDNLPGPVDHWWAEPYTYSPRHPDRPLKITFVEAAKLLSCYAYQACEHPGWRNSCARSFVDALLWRLASDLPGAQEAPWGWDAETLRGR